MTEAQECCPLERVYQEQFRNSTYCLAELKQRVERLEGVLSRAMLLLVANLAGVALMLLQQVL